MARAAGVKGIWRTFKRHQVFNQSGGFVTKALIVRAGEIAGFQFVKDQIKQATQFDL